MDDGSVAGFAILCIFVIPVVGWVVVRYLGHRERMEMIRHGMAPPLKMGRGDWRNAAMPGPDMGMADPGAMRRRRNEPDFTYAGQQIELRKGIRLTCIGFALTLGLSFIGYSNGGFGPTIHPGPWLLGGLIPMFIGIAQVASVLLSSGLAGGSFGPRGPMPQAPFVEPPFTPPPSSPYGVPPTYDASYTYRPGDTQELRPPPAPPERR